jgi:hypothetical protein
MLRGYAIDLRVMIYALTRLLWFLYLKTSVLYDPSG